MSYERPEKKSLWQSFKTWPLAAKLITGTGAAVVLLFGGLLALGGILWAVDPEGMQAQVDEQERVEASKEAEESREAEAEASREAEASKEAEASESAEAEASREAEESKSAEAEASREAEASKAAAEESEESQEPSDMPEGVEEQIKGLSDIDGLEDAEIFFSEGDESAPESRVSIHVEAEPGLTESTMCNSARDDTIKAVQYIRDEVTADYGVAHLSFTAESTPEATGDTSTIPMSGVTYERETVQSIDDEAVTLTNIWEAADSGGASMMCR